MAGQPARQIGAPGIIQAGSFGAPTSLRNGRNFVPAGAFGYANTSKG
ncbi:hypothetical protein V1288_001067 [Bradyrhizobium sp. AZCC 2176]